MTRSFRPAIVAAALALVVSAGAASADTGSYTAAGGEHCLWFGGPVLFHISCSGYSRGQYVNYDCDIHRFGTMTSWDCRSIDGDTWSGSR